MYTELYIYICTQKYECIDIHMYRRELILTYGEFESQCQEVDIRHRLGFTEQRGGGKPLQGPRRPLNVLHSKPSCMELGFNCPPPQL